MSAESPLEFACHVEQLLGDAYLVRVSGEVDLFTAPDLEAELEALERRGAAHVLVDLAGVPFLDSTGLGVLLAFGARLGRSSFAITGLGIESRRVVAITGADRVISVVEPTREVAA